jgi:hypothetical protein
MHVGDVQERDVAERRRVVKLAGRLSIRKARPQRRAGGAGKREEAEKFAPLQKATR